MSRSCCFFFSSRRRHTRCSRDWSSDVCSSDLASGPARRWTSAAIWARPRCRWMRSEERRVGKSVDLGGRRIIKKKKKKNRKSRNAKKVTKKKKIKKKKRKPKT